MYRVTRIYLSLKRKNFDTIEIDQMVNDIEYFRIDVQYFFRKKFNNENVLVTFEHTDQRGNKNTYPFIES
jgi:hypothetical protein